MKTQRILVVWFRFSLNGSIGRFLQLARRLQPWGHDVDFLSLTGDTTTDWPDFPGRVLTPSALEDRTWDAVMVPGAGNPTDPIELLASLQDERFGVRVQHVLNGPSRYDRFELVNRTLQPHVLVFNNGHWSPADYRRLSADAFFTVPGAVDTSVFYPTPLKSLPGDPPRWSIGAFAKKNLAPVLEAIERLPADYRLHVYGTIPGELLPRTDSLLARGRLVDHGSLFGKRLARFYREVDVMVTTETAAGWCNPAAEAMACGVPTIVSRAGTIDFAVSGETAIVLDEITGEAIAREVLALTERPDRMRVLAVHAAEAMRAFDWDRYAQRLLVIARSRPLPAYYRIPEIGLYGKWEPATRLAGLEALLDDGAGSSVLDLGAAEGIISHEFARHGVRLIHGFELSAERVEVADELLADSPVAEHVMRQTDLSDWDRFERENGDVLRSGYDIVLFLGLYHHLPRERRREALKRALDRSRKWFAVRTPADLARSENLVALCEDRGFRMVRESNGCGGGNLGWLGIFRRREGSDREEDATDFESSGRADAAREPAA